MIVAWQKIFDLSVLILGDELSTTARSGVEFLVDLRSRSCPDQDHAKQVLADAV